MLRTITCVEATCDFCSDVAEHDVVVAHFPDEAQALEYLAEIEWLLLTDGRVMCRACIAKQRCEQMGHSFAPWRPCHCHGTVLRHVGTPKGLCGNEFRWCERCDHGEEREIGVTTATAVA